MRKLRLKPNVKKRPVMRGKRMPQPIGVEQRYKEKLYALTKRMTEEVTARILRKFKGPAAREYYAMDALFTNEVNRVVKDLTSKWNTVFNDKAWAAAEKMVHEAEFISGKATTETLKQLSGGFKINTKFTTAGMKNVLKSSVLENVSLIKSIPQQYLQKVEGVVMRAINNGGGAGQIQEQLRKLEGMTEKRAKFIAEDQTRKVYNSMNAKRFKSAGIQKFEWFHSGGGQSPRPLHVQLDGQIFTLDDPPIIQEDPEVRGIPGDLPNCRCTMAPVIEFDEEELENE